MKIVVISDIHSNIDYLRKCMFFIQKERPDKIICLGDIVGYFDQPKQVFDFLMNKHVHCLCGNHEAMLLDRLLIDEKKEEIYQIKKQRNLFTSDEISIISTWLPFYTLFTDNIKILCVHGTPWNPLLGYGYKDSQSILNYVSHDFDYVFMGHTHHPYIMQQSCGTLVNVGSCGLPRDIGNMPSYSLLNTQTKDCYIKRVCIDIDECCFDKTRIHSSVIECLKRK